MATFDDDCIPNFDRSSAMNFRVGQRVKLVRNPGIKGTTDTPGIPGVAIGAEGVVAHVGGGGRHITGRPDVRPDYLVIFGAHLYGVMQYQIEPIVDDGRQVVSWSECYWQPPKVTA